MSERGEGDVVCACPPGSCPRFKAALLLSPRGEPRSPPPSAPTHSKLTKRAIAVALGLLHTDRRFLLKLQGHRGGRSGSQAQGRANNCDAMCSTATSGGTRRLWQAAIGRRKGV